MHEITPAQAERIVGGGKGVACGRRAAMSGVSLHRTGPISMVLVRSAGCSTTLSAALNSRRFQPVDARIGIVRKACRIPATKSKSKRFGRLILRCSADKALELKRYFLGEQRRMRRAGTAHLRETPYDLRHHAEIGPHRFSVFNAGNGCGPG